MQEQMVTDEADVDANETFTDTNNKKHEVDMDGNETDTDARK